MQSIFKEEMVFVKIPPNKVGKKCHAFTYRKIQASSQPVKFVVINDPIRNFTNFAKKVKHSYFHNTHSQTIHREIKENLNIRLWNGSFSKFQMHVETQLLKHKAKQ